MELADNQKFIFDLILKISKQTQSDLVKYYTEWVYFLPGQSIEVGGVNLDDEVKLLDYGLDDLEQIASMGYLKKEEEVLGNPTFFEKTVRYRLVYDLA